MGIATLIAAERLDDRLVDRVRATLKAADVKCGEIQWIDAGDAADLRIEGDVPRARVALAGIDDLDFVVRAGERHQPRLFVADMDSTIIGQECIDELADFAGFKDQVAAITERAMQGELHFASALTERVALLEGMDVASLAECRGARIRPNSGAATLVSTLKAHRVRTALVSGGFTDFVEPIARELGFEHFRANVLKVKNNTLTGRTTGEMIDAAAKRAFAEEMLAELGADAQAMIAIGDGANDIPMVELAGIGIGYRPKPALARIADGLVRFHDLTAVLWMQGIPRGQWVSSG